MDEKKLLEALMGAIEGIDSGCPDCIGGFVESANLALKEIGAGFRYNYNSDREHYDRLQLVSAESQKLTEQNFREIVLPGFRPASWNDFWSCPHWSERQREANRVKAIVRAALDPELPGVPIPVDIEVDCYFASRAQDSDNILAKPMIDALKGWVVPQDDPAIVRTVSVTSFKDRENPRVVIRVISLPGSKPWDERDPNYVDTVGKDET